MAINKKWSSLAYVRYVFFYILGILFFEHADTLLNKWIPILMIGLLAIFYSIFLFFTNKQFKRKTPLLFSLTGFSLIFVLAFCNSLLKKESNETLLKYHRSITAYKAKVIAPPKEKSSGYQVTLEVKQVNSSGEWIESEGVLNAYLPFKHSTPKIGDILLINGQPSPFENTLNPNQFDYKKYMHRQGIYLQHYLPRKNIKKIETEDDSLLSYVYKLREYYSNYFTTYISGKAEQAIALALVLGVKDNLDHEIKDAYSGAGAMHVLAVSGLHVGILSTLIGFVFLGYKKKKLIKWIYIVISVFTLWLYAAITGFSPSVVRACTMFTFVSLAQFFDRQSNIYNTIAASALCMLVYDPNLIFQVGFQLSYIAVLGIIFLYPRIYELVEVNNSILDKLWSISVVSIAAQIATFPISLFYFHQFPVFFLIANPIVIIVATIVVLFGIGGPIILWIFPHFFSELWGFIMNYSIFLMNQVVFKINELPFSRTSPVHLSQTDLILIYSIILLLIIFMIEKKLQYLTFSILIIIAFSFSSVFQKTQLHYQEKLTVYSVKRHTCIGITYNHQAYLLVDENLAKDSKKIDFHTSSHLLSLGYSNYNLINLDSETLHLPFSHKRFNDNLVLVINGKKIAIIDKNIDFLSPAKFDLSIFRNSSLHELSKINSKKTILDASNRIYRNASLKENRSILEGVHITQSKKAYSFSLN